MPEHPLSELAFDICRLIAYGADGAGSAAAGEAWLTSSEVALPERWAAVFGEPAGMRLASADSPGGGGEGDLAHSGGPWTKASTAAGGGRGRGAVLPGGVNALPG